MDAYLTLLNALLKAAARRGYQLHRYHTTADKRTGQRRVCTRYALHQLGHARPKQYRTCEGGLVLEVRGCEGVTTSSHAYPLLLAAYNVVVAKPITHPDGTPDYYYARDGQGMPIYSIPPAKYK